MMRSHLPLHWLRTYETAARHRNFSAAAAELGLTPAAVSHQIRALEGELGFKLFERLARRVELTEIGQAYLPSVSKALDDLLVSTVSLFGGEREAQITVRAPITLTGSWLAPRLHRFYAAFPDIRIRILAGGWIEPGVATDVDIQFGTGNWPGFDVALLLKAQSIIIARRDAVMPRAGDKAMIEALIAKGVVHVMGSENRWVSFARKFGIDEDLIKVNVTTDNSVSAIDMTRAGFGPCLVQRYYAHPVFESGDLTAPLAEGVDIEEAQYVLTSRTAQKKKPAVMLFRKWLLDEAKAYMAGGDGVPPKANVRMLNDRATGSR
ncbi:MAG: LysR family transcriptional regulator [Parvibaculaceae bacterium]